MAREKEQWGTRVGVILAVAGSAVGLGNFLRFPGQAAANGGGTFMIPYFCALLLLGIPVCWAEWSMGKYGGRHGYNSYPAIFGLMGRRAGWQYVGVIGLLIPVIIYMYYVLIESWCLTMAWHYFLGTVDLGNDPSQYVARSTDFFENFTGAKDDGLMMQGSLHSSVIFWVITFAVNFIVIFRGVSKGIERFCMVAMPLLILFAVIILVRVLTLGTPDPSKPEQSVLNGLGFMWNPKPTQDGGSWVWGLLEPKVWLASAGQVFFTLSVGFGIIANYASYLKPNADVALSGLTASSTNEFCEVCLGGLITIPAAFVFLGAAVSDSMSSSFTLGFQTLPVVFQYMPMGRFFGGIWFFMLFLAAITSSLSMLQPAIAFLEEGLNLGRRAACAMLGLITLLGSLFIIYFSKGLLALNTMDFWVGSVMLFVLAMIEVILFSWVFGAKRGYELAMDGAAIRIPRVFTFVIKYITPTYLLVVFIAWCWSALPGEWARFTEPVPRLTLYVIVGTAIFLTILIGIASKRWRLEGADTPAEHGFQPAAGGKP